MVSCILLKHKTLRDKKITPSEIPKALHSKEPINSTCSRLSVGPWENIEISIWHDPNGLSLNDRASKLCSFPIRGDVIFYFRFSDLLKRIRRSRKSTKMKILFCIDSWKGKAIKGVCEKEGKKYWFEISDRVDLFVLSEENAEKIENEHRRSCLEYGLEADWSLPWKPPRRSFTYIHPFIEEDLKGEFFSSLEFREVENLQRPR